MFNKHNKKTTLRGGFLIGGEFKGFEEAGLCVAGAKNMPVACFLGRGRIHVHPDASVRMWTDVHNILKQFIIASIVFVKHKKKHHPLGGVSFWLRVGIRKDGTSAHTGAKKCQVDTSLVRGRIHIPMNAPSMGVGMRILFVVVGYRNSIYSIVFTKHK